MPDQSRFDERIAAFVRRPRVLFLHCGVQHYDWGGLTFIPGLLGFENREHRPYAELWIGAHPDLPSDAVMDGDDVPLDQLIDAAGEVVLGHYPVKGFALALPFLMKVLSARQPLSIQAHPSREQAAAGFRRENELGKAADDPTRNYHDPHHKPELIAALTEFYALSGFRPLQDIERVLGSIPEFAPLRTRYAADRDSLTGLYRHLMTLPEAEVDRILSPLLIRLEEEHRNKGFSKQDPEYWALRADETFSRDGHRDRGLFSVFLLNLVHLSPGQALFLRAGKLHAYLEGSGIEVMADSNNVLRGGLTGKHVDVEELLRILRFSCKPPIILDPEPVTDDGLLSTYRSPAEEFELSRLRLAADSKWRCPPQRGAGMGILINGALSLRDDTGHQLELQRGNAFLAPAGVGWSLATRAGVDLFMIGLPGVNRALARNATVYGSNQ